METSEQLSEETLKEAARQAVIFLDAWDGSVIDRGITELIELRQRIAELEAQVEAMESAALDNQTERIRLELSAVKMREMIQSMITAKGRKYADSEIAAIANHRCRWTPCIACLKHERMLARNRDIEAMEESVRSRDE